MSSYLFIKKILLFFWNIGWDIYLWIRDQIHYFFDYLYVKKVGTPNIKSIEETLLYVKEHKCSMARFGDAEVKYISGTKIWYQSQDPILRAKLAEILMNHNSKVIVGVPGPLKTLEGLREHDRKFWRKHYAYYRKYWYNNMDLSTQYFDSFTSRFYLPYLDKTLAPHYLELWKSIWKDRDLIIIEGEKTRLGVGNDLFDNAKSVKRILGTNTEGFSHYEDLLKAAIQYPKDSLILAAMGPTAKILTTELTALDYQVLDVGHIDIEYEWMRMGVIDKVPVKDKFVNEAGAGAGIGDIDDSKYKSEIVWHY